MTDINKELPEALEALNELTYKSSNGKTYVSFKEDVDVTPLVETIRAALSRPSVNKELLSNLKIVFQGIYDRHSLMSAGRDRTTAIEAGEALKHITRADQAAKGDN